MIAITSKSRSLSLPAYLFIAALFTSSFDKFLVIDLGSTFRFCQLLLLLAIFFAFAKSIRTKALSPPAMVFLNIWTGIAALSMLLHGITFRGAGYSMWLVFNVLVIYATAQIFDTWTRIAELIRYYVASFVFVALFGLFQFFAAIVGLGHFLTIEWWIPGWIPRINGFSYEPSYFATYLMLGWVLIAYLLEQPREQWPVKRLLFWFGVISVALVLCSSRLGYLAMGLWGLRCLAKLPFSSKGRTPAIRKALAACAAAAMAIIAAITFFHWTGMSNFSFLLEGSGIAGTASHSVSERYVAADRTIAVFEANPVIGVGLGGVAEEIAKLRGLDPNDRTSVKLSEASNTGTEILAGTGIIGMIFLVLYFVRLYKQSIRLTRRSVPPHLQSLIKGLLYGLTFEVLMLQVSQNILRPYLWLHMAILSCVVVYASRTARATAAYGKQTSRTRPILAVPLASPQELITR